MNSGNDYFIRLLKLENDVKDLSIRYWNLKKDCEYSHQRMIDLENIIIKDEEILEK